MPASAVPIFACAAIVIGVLGLGAHYMVGRETAGSRTTAEVAPLFARSVELAELPAARWPAGRLDVPYYGPMVELLTMAAEVSRSATAVPQQRQAAKESVRDNRGTSTEVGEPDRKQMKQSSRAKAKRAKDDGASPSGEVDAQEADQRAREKGGTTTRPKSDDGHFGPRRNERGLTNRPQPEAPDSSADRRRQKEWREREPGQRVFAREANREQERRFAPMPEHREGSFTPFRLFGIFGQR